MVEIDYTLEREQAVSSGAVDNHDLFDFLETSLQYARPDLDAAQIDAQLFDLKGIPGLFIDTTQQDPRISQITGPHGVTRHPTHITGSITSSHFPERRSDATSQQSSDWNPSQKLALGRGTTPLPRSSRVSSGPSRTSNACEACKKRRSKCTGHPPCQVCQQRGTECCFNSELDRRRKQS